MPDYFITLPDTLFRHYFSAMLLPLDAAAIRCRYAMIVAVADDYFASHMPAFRAPLLRF